MADRNRAMQALQRGSAARTTAQMIEASAICTYQDFVGWRPGIYPGGRNGGCRMTDDATRYSAKGVAHVDLAAVASPVWLSFVVLPKFTMLAFASAIEPLRIANQLTGQALIR